MMNPMATLSTRIIQKERVEMPLDEMREEWSKELSGILSTNVWTYSPDAFLLTYPIHGDPEGPRYEVALNEMPDSAAVLDWIAQVSRKAWATPRIVGDLVLLLDAVLDLQSSYCGQSARPGKPPHPLPPLT